MQVKYWAVSGLLAVTAVMMCAPFLLRIRRRNLIFSACLGIILYRIVKSIFVECGWGFAACSGVLAGGLLEAGAMCGGLFLFRELRGGYSGETGGRLISGAGVTFIIAGNHLLIQYSLVNNTAVCLLGESAGAALLACSVFLAAAGEEGIHAGQMASFTAICAGAGLVLAFILQMTTDGGGMTSPMLMMLGVCALMTCLEDCLRSKPEISASGFACGIMLAYCFDCMSM